MSDNGVATSTKGYSSLQRGLQLLSLVQDEGRMKIAEISERLDIPLSTVYRYAAVLKNSGYAHEIDGSLIAGERLVENNGDSSHLIQIALPVLWHLRKKTGMTAVLAVRIHITAATLDIALAHPEHRISFGRGKVRSLYAGASALPLLAYAPQRIIEELLSGSMRPYTSNTLTPEIIGPYLQQVRDQGHAISFGQVTPGMVGLGVPVVVDGNCVCSISLIGEETQHRPQIMEALDLLKNGACELATEIGSRNEREVWMGANDATE